MSADELEFASAGPWGVHNARCDSCIVGSHYPIPTWHGWAGPEDKAYALRTGRTEGLGRRCACPCVDDVSFCTEHLFPEPEVVELVSLGADPCAVCGAKGECGYDTDGRPYIHATAESDDEEVEA